MASVQIDLEFERACPRCDGASIFWPPANICIGCNSIGMVTTELGDTLLEFLERHGLVLKAEGVSNDNN